MNLEKIDVTESQVDKALTEYQYFLIGRTKPFIASLFETITLADKDNLLKLSKAYPEYVYAYIEVSNIYFNTVYFNIIKDK